MRALLAILLTVGLLAGCYIVSALIYFDLTWILILVTAIWAGIDSSKIQLNRFKLGIACRPVALFCLCALFWILIFPWYLWARYKIKNGSANLKDDILGNVGPVRRFFRRFSRIAERAAEYCLIGLVILKTGFVLFCLEESWRGEKAWETCKRELEARGETIDWNAFIPPLVPDTENFFCAPRMSRWFVRQSEKIVIADSLTNRLNYPSVTAPVLLVELTITMPDTSLDLGKTNILLKFNEPASRRQAIELIQGLVGPCAFGLQGVEMFVSKPLNTNQFRPSQVILEVDKRPTPREIVEFFDRNGGGSGSLRIKTVGSNSYQISTPVCAAADYLAWSDRFRGDFDLIRKALERPYVRMDGDYHDPLTIPLPNFVAFRTVAQTLAQRAQCYLLLGQPEGAVQELTQLRDLCRVLEGAPTGKPMTLVAAMINVVINGGLYADVIADGLRLHAWQEPQLVLLQKQLGQINLGPCMVESFRAERACAWRTMQTNVLAKLAVQRPNATLWQKMRNLRPPNIVKGFFFFNMVTIAKLHQDLIDSIDPVHKTVVPRRIGEFEREQETLGRHFSPYTFYAVIMIPNFANAVRTFACNQTRIHQAKTACALELYRSKRGEYPERLDELAPQTISELPQDIVGGRGLKYRRTSDGDFLLYSIGWNETDDGGEICSSSPGGGDWVWP